ncbi:MAG: hypothetical protein QOG49_276, partial [Frankiaceae bacterium]|nr:hypothetical protein [Frankiaceae bacterium]
MSSPAGETGDSIPSWHHLPANAFNPHAW